MILAFKRDCAATALALLAMTVAVRAEDLKPTSVPATQAAPATTQAARYTLTLPPGCELFEVAGRKVICEPADKPLVERALQAVGPTTRPATMPSDLLTRLRAQRSELAKRIADDFAVADAKPIDQQLEKLVPDLEKLQAFRPPLFYLCMSRSTLKAMLKEDRWKTPSIYYNRLMDELLFQQKVPLAMDRPMDDTLIIALRENADDDAAFQKRIANVVRSTDDEVAKMVAGAGMYMVQSTLADVIAEQVFAPLKPPPDQQWLNVGMSRAMSADYSQDIIGSPRNELLLLIAADFQRNPIKLRTIDLLHPADRNSLKRQYVVAYADAYQRKSVLVALKILEKGRSKLPALMKSVREKPCGSGEELVQRIRETTGVDVSKDVGTQ